MQRTLAKGVNVHGVQESRIATPASPAHDMFPEEKFISFDTDAADKIIGKKNKLEDQLVFQSTKYKVHVHY